MDKAGHRQLCGAHSAADLFFRFIHRNGSTAMNHSDSGGKPIGAGADDHGIVWMRLSHQVGVVQRVLQTRGKNCDEKDFDVVEALNSSVLLWDVLRVDVIFARRTFLFAGVHQVSATLRPCAG